LVLTCLGIGREELGRAYHVLRPDPFEAYKEELRREAQQLEPEAQQLNAEVQEGERLARLYVPAARAMLAEPHGEQQAEDEALAEAEAERDVQHARAEWLGLGDEDDEIMKRSLESLKLKWMGEFIYRRQEGREAEVFRLARTLAMSPDARSEATEHGYKLPDVSREAGKGATAERSLGAGERDFGSSRPLRPTVSSALAKVVTDSAPVSVGGESSKPDECSDALRGEIDEATALAIATAIFDGNQVKRTLYWYYTGLPEGDFHQARIVAGLKSSIANGKGVELSQRFLAAAEKGLAREFIADRRAESITWLQRDLISGEQRALDDARKAGFAL
jgi:hypothetical protein